MAIEKTKQTQQQAERYIKEHKLLKQTRTANCTHYHFELQDGSYSEIEWNDDGVIFLKSN